MTRHGHSRRRAKHPVWVCWSNIINRCNNPNHSSWANYGGRGIDVCKRWKSYENFFADMGSTYQPGLTIERVDNSKGYSPENCRWATRAEQVRNNRRTVIVDGVCLIDAAKQAGLSYRTVRHRIERGWPRERWLEPADLSRVPFANR